MRAFPWLLATVVALNSCAKLGGDRSATAAEPSPFGATGIPPAMRSKGEPAGTPVVPGGNVPANSPAITPDEDIIFLDPDNPEATLPELSAVLGANKSRGPWEDSETLAKQRAAREGKPLLIWFTDSQSSPMCKALSQELFTRPEFEHWATEKLIRLRIDSNVGGSAWVNEPTISLGEKDTRRVDAGRYVANLKKRYKVMGHPTLLLLNPSGEVIGRYRGYSRGQADFTWGLLKQGEAASADAYRSWKSSLEKKGYREWSDRRGRKVFAKLASYSKGTLILIEPDGTRCKAEENQLSDTDRAWITEQKKSRGIN